MRKMGIYAAAAALACAAMPSAAYAVPMIDFNGTSGAFTNTNIGPGEFDDLYTFSVADMGIVSGTITSIAVELNPATDIDFSSVMLNGIEFTTIFTGETEFRRITNLPVQEGEQTLRVRGVSAGNGAYAGTLAFGAVQQVPEPAGWTTLAVALGLLVGGMKLSRGARRQTA